jgi:Na+-translocating ferredoxin:NAD+ oxidoreductase RnfG subunit
MKSSLTALVVGPTVVLVAPVPALGAQVFLREADAPRAIFPESTAATRKTLDLNEAELAALGKALARKIEVRRYSYLEVRSNSGTIGFIFMLDVIGQSQPIGFAVGVTPDGTLQDVQVMVYREPQGEEIQEKRFRKQFTGKRLKDPIALGKDIDAISGATISSRSATYAARKGLVLVELLRARSGAEVKP